MKKALIIFSAIFLVVALFQIDEANAQDRKTRRQIARERKDLQKALKDRAVRPARKEARRLSKKEGWTTFPGDRVLDKMLEEAWMKDEETIIDETNIREVKAFISATGNAVGGSATAAKMQAIETAKLELAGQLETKMASLINVNIANAQLNNIDGESITEIQQNAKNIVSTTLKNVEPVILIYRTPETIRKSRSKKKLAKGKIEVQCRLFYDMYRADDVAREAIKSTMRDKLKDNEEDLRKLMGL